MCTIQVEPANIEDITFSSKQPPGTSRKIEPPTEEEFSDFCSALNTSKAKPALLKIMPPYSKQFIPKLCDKSLPPLISELYDQNALGMNYLDLLAKCEEASHTLKVRVERVVLVIMILAIIKVSLEQIVTMEKSTHRQAQNKLWFRHREGRITASNFKAAARTSRSMPAVSLIKRICYPQAYKFSTKSTR